MEEQKLKEPYKCALCGERFDSREQLQKHERSCTPKKE